MKNNDFAQFFKGNNSQQGGNKNDKQSGKVSTKSQANTNRYQNNSRRGS